ncbi:MAG: M2 family metallopeptidase [Bacteroidales bacterium]|nr:M2 family metallopeptidase [Bacteroidales bacterium]
MMKKLNKIFLAVLAVGLLAGCQTKQKQMKEELVEFIRKHDSVVVPLSRETNLAYWQAAITGSEEDFNKAQEFQLKMVEIFSDTTALETLQKIKVSGLVNDTLLSRQLDLLYNQFLMAKADTSKLNEIVKMETKIEREFSIFRTQVDGKELTDNDVEEILRSSRNVNQQKKAWMAQKKIGQVVADDVIKLVILRNEVAKDMGFKNYHQMQLILGEQDPRVITDLFNELDTLTKGVYAEVKDDIDNYFVNYYNLKSKEDLMPWNYQNRFFQEAPRIYDVDLSSYYAGKNLESLTAAYYYGIGLPIDDMLKNSDLYEKEGKNQHAFCINIDKLDDVRVLCNIKSNSYWMNTMLHEYGHAVYDYNIDHSLPFILREPAHTFTTEAIAMLFGRQASSPQWLHDMVGISEEEKMKIAENCFKTLRLEQLVFSRWSQVMYRFEKAMYEDPEQDLNTVWWDLVEEYQLMKRPPDRNEPDWATKIHMALFPCYYHNYLLGELLASQLYYHIVANVLQSDDFKFQSFVNNKEVGDYLKANVFAMGSKYYWNDMIEKATGEKLTATYYAKQFVE